VFIDWYHLVIQWFINYLLYLITAVSSSKIAKPLPGFKINQKYIVLQYLNPCRVEELRRSIGIVVKYKGTRI